jgi:hypothetical protein
MVAATSSPRTIATGTRLSFPKTSWAAPAIWSASAIRVCVELVAGRVLLSVEDAQRPRRPPAPIATSVVPARHGAPNES